MVTSPSSFRKTIGDEFEMTLKYEVLNSYVSEVIMLESLPRGLSNTSETTSVEGESYTEYTVVYSFTVTDDALAGEFNIGFEWSDEGGEITRTTVPIEIYEVNQ